MTTPDRPAESGFTLLELLVVTVVFGLLTTALWEGLSIGTRGWSQGQRLYDSTAELQGMEDALRRVIARAEPSDSGLPPSFGGLPDRLRLIAWLPQDGGWHRDIEAGLGLNARHELVLRWRPFRRAACVGDDVSFREEVLAGNVRSVTFSYYGRKGDVHVWQDGWTAAALPLLVRVRIDFIDGARTWPTILVRPLLAGNDS
jgi:general secretion pathway protein J